MVRLNSSLEIQFQGEIQAAFERYHVRLGFGPMADNLLAWIIANFQLHAQHVTREKFLEMVGTIWDECAPMGTPMYGYCKKCEAICGLPWHHEGCGVVQGVAVNHSPDCLKRNGVL